jgi:glutamate synthase domain-containing protein 3
MRLENCAAQGFNWRCLRLLWPFNLTNHLIGPFGLNDVSQTLRHTSVADSLALFGATGGRTFIEGQAGDRFVVRNSGATAVVEGVGDFCAEYMTNGAVLNLGAFSAGYGNGMSGGFAYQYDPDRQLEGSVSHDSVLLGSITDGTKSPKPIRRRST